MDGRADHSALIGFSLPSGRCAITAVTTGMYSIGWDDAHRSEWTRLKTKQVVIASR